jgi:hypothetical protein
MSHTGRRRRADLSPEQKNEWDAAGIKEAEPTPMSPADQEEARRPYEETVRAL